MGCEGLAEFEIILVCGHGFQDLSALYSSSQVPHDDILVWGAEATGEFLVRNRIGSYARMLSVLAVQLLLRLLSTFFTTAFMCLLLNVDSLKINFDAAYCANTRTSCSRIVIWNCLGCVIGSSMVINRSFPSAFAVKAIAYSQAILLGLDLGIPNVIMEGDALTMIWRVLSPAPDNLVLGAYIRDIKCQARPFHHLSFGMFFLYGNIVVHLVAKGGFVEKDYSIPKWAGT
ncbi:hypothetical protein Godav_019564 [Gossypium davidsonii]|uniref:RNase H type-1 domain-containing protein n=1 Tax=Gossypium davidsonii TaxID=34287 RepID=A0A7J8R090_GOSDV|nr:hypothetical protein [Gossypium davidsonii]